MLKKGDKIETEVVKSIGFKKAVGIFKRSYSEIPDQFMRFKLINIILVVMVITLTYLSGLSLESTFIGKDLSPEEVIYNYSSLNIIANLMSPLYYLFIMAWFFTYISVRFDYNSNKLKYFIVINPRFYFYIISFSTLIFLASWISFSLLYNNYTFITYENLLNPNISVTYLFFSEFLNMKDSGMFFILFLAFIFVYLFIVVNYLFLISFYNGYCMRRGFIKSIKISILFFIKNKIFTHVFMLFFIVNISLMYLANIYIDNILVSVVNIAGFLFIVNSISILMKNTVRLIKY